MKPTSLIILFFVLSCLNGYSQTIRYQEGYFKPSTGTYVEPHYKTNNNSTNWDNFSTKGNYNPFNGNPGYKAKDFSIDADNYGKGQNINVGPRGGQYYYNSKGNKTYVPKR